MTVIRVATIGTSKITRRFAAAVTAVDGIQISCAFSRDPGRAGRFAEELGVSRWESDLGRLLASNDFDAVYVASPNGVHHAQALAAIRAGKHVLIEKPAVPTADEWADLVSEADVAGVVLLEGIRNEYDPGICVVADTLPLLGPIRRVSFRYQKRSDRYDLVLAGQRVNMFDPSMAGGALLDLGVYCAHALIRLFGPPDRVIAATIPVSSGSDGAGAALAVYPEFIADLNYSKITTSVLPSEIQGEEATLLIDHIASARSLRVHFRDGRTQHHTLTDPPHSLIDEVRRFVDLVSSGLTPFRDNERTYQTLQLTDAIRESWVTTQ